MVEVTITLNLSDAYSIVNALRDNKHNKQDGKPCCDQCVILGNLMLDKISLAQSHLPVYGR